MGGKRTEKTVLIRTLAVDKRGIYTRASDADFGETAESGRQ